MLKVKKFFTGRNVFLFLPLTLSIFGLLMIFEASSVSALRDFGDKFYYFKHQMVWWFFGIVSFFVFSSLNFRIWRKLALVFFVLTIFFLVLVLIPKIGLTVYGGRRWISVGLFRFQPAELAKLSLIIYISSLFEKKKGLLPFLAVVGLVLGLLILEPDLGTAVIIIASVFSIYFISGVSFRQIAGMGVIAAVLSPALILLSSYRRERFFAFLKSFFSAKESSYHVRQILLALGTGGFFGRGLGQSKQKFLFLPEVTTDSIFAIIAEEFGFLGATLIIFLFVYLVVSGFKLAVSSKDPFGQMLTVGIITCVGVQASINFASMVTLIPLTGVPLPFISYGGSSLLITLSGMGIIYNISKQQR
ncbi:stage V sporulation protein E [Candidatus Shapirobacteria bacterium CG03_land_8_20_14_0_80_39_12]|uniref:Probable peptidoglycan glycosyltransferase FtsW n=1 Tax=Candidatus Shapirobacteria bacterium CG03_land_8_20_14_0_80_39_12 TaxID=1974879 RepID=A0A2M7BDU8_9BACT|nr:MAG: stage V sporulation protein E [Candidatus Shapirobacteria bacterium CG03_land_8_20_14_0_80_39_12]